MATLEATVGQQVTLTSASTVADAEWNWIVPEGSSAPSSTTNVLQWIIADTDFGEYKAVATSDSNVDNPQETLITIDERKT